jgi:Uma2 family endonuclease
MATITVPVTPAEFDRMDPEEGRFELLNGEVIEMASASGPHNFLAGKLERSLGSRLDMNELGVVIHETEFRIGENRFRPTLRSFCSPAGKGSAAIRRRCRSRPISRSK